MEIIDAGHKGTISINLAFYLPIWVRTIRSYQLYCHSWYIPAEVSPSGRSNVECIIRLKDVQHWTYTTLPSHELGYLEAIALHMETMSRPRECQNLNFTVNDCTKQITGNIFTRLVIFMIHTQWMISFKYWKKYIMDTQGLGHLK